MLGLKFHQLSVPEVKHSQQMVIFTSAWLPTFAQQFHKSMLRSLFPCGTYLFRNIITYNHKRVIKALAGKI
jgi:hypothetical protein